MPSPSLQSLLQRAIPFAQLDRESLADAYFNKGPEAARALETRDRLQALKGRPLRSLTPEERQTAFEAFVYAEQWEESLADSKPGRAVELRCRRNVHYFKAARHHLFGKTVMEVEMENAVSVTVYPSTDESITSSIKKARGSKL